MRVEATPEAAAFIRANGGQLFVWPTEHRSYRLSLTLLDASVDPPPRALDFRRVVAHGFLLFLHPGMVDRRPERLVVELRGRRRPHIEVYWEGVAYVV